MDSLSARHVSKEFRRQSTMDVLWSKVQDQVREHSPVFDRVKHFADLTTAHGAKHVLEARSTFSRLSWLLLILILTVVVVLVIFLLTDKYSRHERITFISIKFDEVEFPAVTFCNLNPYKRSLIRLIPAVRDTMDVFDNARTASKDGKKPNFRRSELVATQEKRIKDLFRTELEEEERESGGYTISDSSKSNRIPRAAKEGIKTSSHTYEAIEAHCVCLGHPEMECIRFETPPKKETAKCICTFDMTMDKVWPCFNSTVWYDHVCPSCADNGLCEAKLSQGTEVSRTIQQSDGKQYEGFPCACRNRSPHYETIFAEQKPYCIRKSAETRRLWDIKPSEPPQRMVVITPKTTVSTVTLAPPTVTRIQRPIVTAPETISAMGFSGMTDGVAMQTQARKNLMFTMASLSREQREALSQELREFVEMCSFNGHECDFDRDFKLHVDPEFGNCYTFNHDVSRNLTSSRAGPMYGIRVLLFVNASDYISTSESSGVRLAIHPATQYPFPDTFGYSAPTGFSSSFGIKKQKIERLPGYGDCEEHISREWKNNIYAGYEYNAEGCHRSCFQSRMLEDCECGDPRFPVPAGKRHCSAFNATARNCLESKIGSSGDFHHVPQAHHECECKHACKEVVYSMTFSTSRWPSGATELGDCDGRNEKQCVEFYGRNAALVEVYYEQLNYELLQESEAYGIVNLIADFGGHLGLWLGFSVITVVEVITLIVELIQVCFHKRRERKKLSYTAEL